MYETLPIPAALMEAGTEDETMAEGGGVLTVRLVEAEGETIMRGKLKDR